MKKIKKAIALKYKINEDSAPRVVAKGKGYVAEKIINKAKENMVEVVENNEMAEALYNVEITDQIPNEMFEAVAGILAFVYKMDKNNE